MSEAPETNDQLPAFLVALQKHHLLIPEATVAEIIAYEPLQRVQDTPDWFLGVLGWRGIQVPVISVEMLTMARASFSLASVSSASLVIVRALGGGDDLPYFALVAQTPPRLNQVTPDELFEEDDPPQPTELARVRFQKELAAIPDMAFIEAEIRKVSFD